MTQLFPTSAAEWTAQKAQIEERIAAHQAELETAASWDGVRFLQGQIASLRWLLDAAEPTFRPGQGSANYANYRNE